MPGIVLQTDAVKVVNKGGGFPTRMVRQELDCGPFMPKKQISERQESIARLPGTDYVVFICPAPSCGRRNKKSVYEAKAQTGDGRLSFKCTGCFREVEVQRPMTQRLTIEQHKAKPDSQQPAIILGPNGLPIRGR